MVADGFRLDIKVIQELLRLARIFAGDQISISQHSKRSQSDILKISNGRSEYI
jgi:hypothetical protein